MTAAKGEKKKRDAKQRAKSHSGVQAQAESLLAKFHASFDDALARSEVDAEEEIERRSLQLTKGVDELTGALEKESDAFRPTLTLLLSKNEKLADIQGKLEVLAKAEEEPELEALHAQNAAQSVKKKQATAADGWDVFIDAGPAASVTRAFSTGGVTETNPVAGGAVRNMASSLAAGGAVTSTTSTLAAGGAVRNMTSALAAGWAVRSMVGSLVASGPAKSMAGSGRAMNLGGSGLGGVWK